MEQKDLNFKYKRKHDNIESESEPIDFLYEQFTKERKNNDLHTQNAKTQTHKQIIQLKKAMNQETIKQLSAIS